MLIFFIALSCVLAIGLGVSMYFNVKHGTVIIDMEDACSHSLDTFDQAYKSMSDVLEMNIMLDTPEVREIVKQIKQSRDAVLYVSNILSEPFGGIIEEPVVEEEDGRSS